jgi:hypothetical protein
MAQSQPLKIQPFQSFLGFGNGSNYQQGEYEHSEGMRRTQHGLSPGWNVTTLIDSAALSGLAFVNFFTEAITDASVGHFYVYGIDANGLVYRNLDGTSGWTLIYSPATPGKGNGLIGLPTGQLFYLGSRYLGQFDGTPNYTTGTIGVTNASTAVTGSGTSWTTQMVGCQILIGGVAYIIAAVGGATSITLTIPYAGSTASGLSYTIYAGWQDQFQDFEAGGAPALPALTDYRDSDSYEDTIIICNGNNFATYNVVTQTFNSQSFLLPSSDFARAVKSGSNGILMGINRLNRGAYFLWDNASDGSIAPWIWKNGNIQCIVPYDGLYPFNGGWIVITDREIVQTNGYFSRTLVHLPNEEIGAAFLNVAPQGAIVLNNKLIIANTTAYTNRLRPGYLILDLDTLMFEYCPVAGGATFNNTMGPIFFDSLYRTHVCWQTQIPAKYYLGYIDNGSPDHCYYIAPPLGVGNNEKTAEGIKLKLGISPQLRFNFGPFFKVSVKLYDFRRNLWNFVNTVDSVLNDNSHIVVDGTLYGNNQFQVGDEVTFMEGVNAGITTHITEIQYAGSSEEVWTLMDTDNGAPLNDTTETGATVQVMPFRFVNSYDYNDFTDPQFALRLPISYFDVKDKVRAQQYLIKVLFENINTNESAPPELMGGDFVYNDLATDIL